MLNSDSASPALAPLQISLDFTPNPRTLKYNINRPVSPQGAIQFSSRSVALDASPLVAEIFEVPGVEAVMLGADFVTITKSEDSNWDDVHENSQEILQLFFEQELSVLNAVVQEVAHESYEDNSEVAQKIREILELEVRPAVARDGGDIVFEHFDNGVVFVRLKGSCQGCPSSTMTLKMGIETRLKQAIPEVKEVVSV